MSWKTSLQVASFRGVTFDVIRTHDSAKRDLAEHEYPYKDGADVEDLGRKAMRPTVTAVFWGDNYEKQLQTFIKALDTAGYGELIHPVFGSMPKMQLESYSISHDAEHPDYCTVELQFVDSTPSNPFFVKAIAVQKAAAVSSLTSTALSAAMSAYSNAISAIAAVKAGLKQANALKSVITGTINAIRSQIQSVITTALDVIHFPSAFVSDIVSCLNGLVDLRGFSGATLMPDWKGLVSQLSNIVKLPAHINTGTATTSSHSGMVSVGATVAMLASSASGSSSSGSSSGSSGGNSGSSSGSTTSSSSTVQAVGSSLVPVGASPEQVALVTTIIQLAVATVLAETAAGILEDEADDPTLTPQDIEQIANDVRAAVQTSIDQHRALYTMDVYRPIAESLKDTAQAIQEAAVAVMDQLPTLGQRTVTVAGNMHLIAFAWYDDYTRADELVRLNPNVRNPNFVYPGTILNAYLN